MPRGVVQEAEAVEEKPVKSVLMSLNGLGYLFLAAALAAGIAWVVYVARAVDEKDELNGNSDPKVPNFEIATFCFQGAVVAVLLYFVARHHYSMHY